MIKYGHHATAAATTVCSEDPAGSYRAPEPAAHRPRGALPGARPSASRDPRVPPPHPGAPSPARVTAEVRPSPAPRVEAAALASPPTRVETRALAPPPPRVETPALRP